jgi:hypothetical protein
MSTNGKKYIKTYYMQVRKQKSKNLILHLIILLILEMNQWKIRLMKKLK